MPEVITCAGVRAQLVPLLDNELPPVDAASLREHIAGCPECEREYDALIRLGAVTNSWHVPSQSVMKRLASKIPGLTAALHPRPPVAETAKAVLQRLRETGWSLGDVLADLGLSDDVAVARSVAEAQNLPFIDLTKHRPEAGATDVLPAELARKHRVLPVRLDGRTLFLATADARDITALDAVRLASRCMVRPLLAAPAELERQIRQCYGPGAAAETDVNATLLTELRALRDELWEARGEIAALRGEVAELRQAARERPRPASATPRTSRMPQLLPYGGPAETPSLLS